MITIDGNTLRVRFDQFGPEQYKTFLKVKSLPEYQLTFDDVAESYEITAPARFAKMMGLQVAPSTISDSPLFDPNLFNGQRLEDQIVATKMAIEARRFAYWAGCGLGKSLVELEYSRQVSHITGGKVLIFPLNEIVPQFFEMATQFYGDNLPLERIRSREQMKEWAKSSGPGIAVTNYEKLNHGADDQVVNELRNLAGVVVDENRLKTGGGKQKWALIKSCKGVEYKLSCTATPAPNDIAEFASQASFLEKMRSGGEAIWTYFMRDEKTHRWTIKKHARKAFFEFMSGWSLYVNDPRRYGWRKNHPDIPPPIMFRHSIPMTDAQRSIHRELSSDPTGQLSLFEKRSTNTIQRSKLSQVAKGFIYRKTSKGRTETETVHSLKPDFVASLTRDESKAGYPVIVWTVFDAESTILSAKLTQLGVRHSLLTGKTSKGDRELVLDCFRRGEVPVLITRASLVGFGMNFQFCKSFVVSGWTDGFESFYQLIRRAFRFGQTDRLRVHLPCVEELEGEQLENILQKEAQHEAVIAEMESHYIEAIRRVYG